MQTWRSTQVPDLARGAVMAIADIVRLIGIVSIMPAFQSYAGEWEAEYFQKKEE